ncbi:restriction endonuclease subunit S [Saccharococcus caldoxylosilyticus]|uniref:Type I restriction enzyme EcoKI specificity protein n=1 Tax=Parageobacillus caldoxylosilyticus NBRC 107762 TaxID=1220594 RepID=A0A023DKD9_9BACL|nr:restriction endonuclease subunit S [Parageobacillus caldoxylosilyticus]MBB3854379.1 type I restriction enzyme S subunit [Parageobacillus caldoxylosilyticus]GAJ41481.1 type I restriction enzyme EcoKI specificity protein [Parageobacillus caldoxylosilyticus NBRC 107762]
MSKKQKTIEELLEEALVPEEEQPYEVPENWVWVKSTYVLDIEYGKGLPISKLTPNGYPVYGANGKIGFYKEYTQEEPRVLMTCRGATCGTINISEPKSFVTSNSLILKPKWNANIKFLAYLFKTLDKKDLISGSAQPQITVKAFEKYYIPLPPINEQTRIAEKIEQLFAKIDEAKQLIEEAKETFKLRRAAILDKAFRGELTQKWRETNEISQTAEQWLEDITVLKKSRTKFIDQLDPKVLENLYKLPPQWKWVRLNDLIETSTYGTSAKANDDASGTPVIRMGNIIDGRIVPNDLKYLPNEHEDVKKYDLETNDLLFNRTNSYELVGKTALVGEEFSQKVTFASYLIRVRLYFKEILAPYVCFFINSHIGRSMLLSMATQQVGQANINSQKLASLPIPLPPKEEVAIISNWLSAYQKLEDDQKALLSIEKNIEEIKQSILSKAFRGELGTNDPTEESAIELLKEVLQEKVK